MRQHPFTDYRYNPFLLLVQHVRPAMRDRVPAITHVDGTGHLYSVTAEHSPPSTDWLPPSTNTSVPMVLNASFTVRGARIVHRPQNALED